MRSRQRKFFGAILMIVFVIVYALFAMVLAQATAMKVENSALRLLIFAILGLGWAVPMVPLISWMERGEK